MYVPYICICMHLGSGATECQKRLGNRPIKEQKRPIKEQKRHVCIGIPR